MTKTRINKKLVALATTIMMLVAMLIPVSAAPGNPEGSITVHKFSGTSIGAATANTTGVQLTPTELAAIAGAGYTPLADAEFTLYALPQAEINALTGAITATNGVEGHIITIVGGFPVVTWTLEDGSTHTATATAAYGTPQVTDTAGQAVFGSNDIPDGYYVLVETDTPEGYQTVNPSLIRLPMTDGSGNRNYDVHVYPKNISTEGVAVKTINGLDTPLSGGERLNFELKGKFIGADVSSAASLRNDGPPATYGVAEIQDNFSNAFQYVGGSVTVHWLNAAGDITGAALPASHYTITDTATGSPGGDLIVRLTPAGIDAAIAANAPGFGLRLQADYVGSPGVGESITNKMTLILGAADGVIEPPIIIEIHAPTINIQVKKVSSAATGSLPLDGVVFLVARTAAPTVAYTPGTPASAFTPAQLAALATNYVVDGTGVPIVGTTDMDGEILFTNLSGYTNAGTSYYLIELETKAGYQLNDVPTQVAFASRADYQSANPGWFNGTDWKENVTVIENATVTNFLLTETNTNEPGFSLPLTGGAGTLAFTAIGILVMLGAAVVYLQGKKKNV